MTKEQTHAAEHNQKHENTTWKKTYSYFIFTLFRLWLWPGQTSCSDLTLAEKLRPPTDLNHKSDRRWSVVVINGPAELFICWSFVLPSCFCDISGGKRTSTHESFCVSCIFSFFLNLWTNESSLNALVSLTAASFYSLWKWRRHSDLKTTFFVLFEENPFKV